MDPYLTQTNLNFHLRKTLFYQIHHHNQSDLENKI
ncbi:unnamed protein product [Schistosoma mattheei]|uniref:Uncharacterized protein n=1 Tax=Schistosoma mattheei TaxID=31246 RepID=A0A183PER3_9TREM|nr:unnamed protein product [Schistosoma mattheei]